MTTRTTIAAAVAMAAAVACGGNDGQRDQQVEATHEASGASAAAAWDGNAQLRLLGVNAAAFGKAELKIRAVEVRAGATVIETSGLMKTVDLTVPNQAWLLGTLSVPQGTRELDVAVTFEDEGRFDDGKATGKIDAACVTVRFKVVVELLKPRSHAVCHLDLARSMIRKEKGGMLLVPHFELHY